MNATNTLTTLAAIAVLTACSPPPVEAPRTPAVLVRTIGAAAATPSGRAYTGEIRPRIETELAFRIGGKMQLRKVDAGEQVRAGQVLASLDPVDAQLAATAAQTRVSAAEADAALARAELKRAETLISKKFLSESALDTRRTALEAAEANLRQARAQAGSANNQTGYAELRAASDGVVTQVLAETGQVVAAGQPVFRLAHSGQRELQVFVPESRLNEIKTGDSVEVRLWIRQDQPLKGLVREISPSADSATRTYGVRISLADGDTLPLGATATALFMASHDNSVRLPLSAVTRNGDQASIWTVDEHGKTHPQAVEILSYQENGAVLRSQLPSGARVVLTGVHKLVAGGEVRPVEEGSTPALDVKR